MKGMTLEQIAKACNGSYIGDSQKKEACVTGITTDSRAVEDGYLFIPVKGARVDGHDFIPQVIEAGVVCCLSEKSLVEMDIPYILVKSTLQAIKDIAQYYRSILNIKVVGITGSVGKTSTKEMIASILEQKYSVLKTLGNFNNELGLPFTIFRIREEEIAVLEMGISDFGEMHRLSKIARPDVCVITNIGDCHLENLKDRAGVLKAKTEMFDYIEEDGTIILNGDDFYLAGIKEVKGITPQFFGIESGRDIYADEIVNKGLGGMACRLHIGRQSINVHISIPGNHMIYNALAGACVGHALGMDLDLIKKGIECLEPVGGRNNILHTEKLVIVDDCYNANPVSMKASIDVLANALGRKTAILGDMFELGENEIALHESVGIYAAEQNIDVIICVGKLSEYMALAAKKQKNSSQIIYVKDRDELLENLSRYVEKGDTVLVKASHGMHFEKVVEKLTQI
jgi:UDP-N-acetylmuramoyl-tripeptide--D-alanyl-D-alanine ligase